MCSESLLTFLEFFERVLDISPEKLGAYEPGQYQPLKGDFKPDFTERIRFIEDFGDKYLILRLSMPLSCR